MNSQTHTPPLLRQPSFSAQRPLIDVARNYCKNFVASKENYSAPPTQYSQKASPMDAQQGLSSRFTWRAQSSPASSTIPAAPLSRPPNLYSWKASSAKSPLADASSPTGNITPRPPKSLSRLPAKMEPLTVTINKEDRVSSCGSSPQSPLQPFSPTSDSKGCSCLRSPKLILCKSCGEIQRGRLSMACPVHPRQVFLMDMSCCAACKSTNLKEICDAKK